MTKWPVQKQTHNTAQKHAEHQDATDNLKIVLEIKQLQLIYFKIRRL